jgi:hypothetical protein
VRGFLLLLVIVAPAVIYLGYRSWQKEQKRREALAAWAMTSGHTYVAEDNSWCRRWNGTPFGEGDHRRAREVIIGNTSQQQPFVAFDYSYQTHSTDGQGHTTTTTHRFAVAAITLPANLPGLQVTPESMFSRIGHAFGLDDIELESEDFNRRFRVHGDDRKFACDVLTPRTMEQLLARPAVSWRITGTDALCWTNGQLNPAGVQSMLAHLALVIGGIPSFVWKDHGAAPAVPDVATPSPGGTA